MLHIQVCIVIVCYAENMFIVDVVYVEPYVDQSITEKLHYDLNVEGELDCRSIVLKIIHQYRICYM